MRDGKAHCLRNNGKLPGTAPPGQHDGRASGMTPGPNARSDGRVTRGADSSAWLSQSLDHTQTSNGRDLNLARRGELHRCVEGEGVAYRCNGAA